MWIEVFKAGTQTDSSGDTKEWTQEDIDAIVSKYNDQTDHEAPIVVGHPLDNSPAYGWVEALKAQGGMLLAKIKQLDTQFKELVNQGRYKKVSIALYPNLLLRHIGFLGAMPPAVKGLKTAKFNEEEDYLSYELEQSPKQEQLFSEIGYNEELDRELPEKYNEYTSTDFADYVHKRFPIKTEAEVLSSLASFNKEEIQKKYSETDRIVIAARLLQAARSNKINLTPKIWSYQEVSLPAEELSKKQLINALQRKNDLPTNEEFSDMNENLVQELLDWLAETFSEEVSAQTAAKIEELKGKYPTEEGTPAEAPAPEMKEEFSEREIKMQQRIEELERKTRENEHTQFVEGLMRDGKLVPAQKDMVMPLLEATRHSGNLTFTEAGKTKEETTHDLFKRFAGSFPNIVQMNEFADSRNVEKKAKINIELPSGTTVDEESEVKYSQALQYIEEQGKAGKTVTIQDAVKHIERNR
jgi:hypothetical protein